MKALPIAFMGTLSLLMYGCLVDDGKSSKELVSVDDGFPSAAENTSLPKECEKILELSRSTKTGTIPDHVIFRKYRYKKDKDCTVLVGRYVDYGYRNKMSSSASLRNYSKHDGSFDAVSRVMKEHGVTCEASRSGLVLIFPRGSRGHRDYQRVELGSCTDRSDSTMEIGLDEEGGDRLAITTSKRMTTAAGRNVPASQIVFHTFDTDNRGVIKKHTVLSRNVDYSDDMGKPQVILDNYRKR